MFDEGSFVEIEVIMDVQEIVKTVENVQGNVTTGIVIIIYYLIVYWPRIKDGLGLGSRRQVNLDKIERNYQLLKLRIEIEQQKKASGLDDALLDELEQEMQSRLVDKKGKPFSNVQKFVAIPLVIMIFLQSFLELQALNQDSVNSAVDIVSGTIFILTVVVVGFWGIPVLQRQSSGWFRKTGFIVFWVFGFYILAYVLVFIMGRIIFQIEQLSDVVLGLLFLMAIASSIVLGIFNKLPFMGGSSSKR
jgi:hypothetical protein